MPEQRARSAVAAELRSVHPRLIGIPWWGAVLTAVAVTTVGFAFDAGTGRDELGAVFAAAYLIGCVLAVLAVRQSGLFTAVIQPPLLLFVSVPGAYFLFHSGQIDGIKDLLINCGYPLIERFPLMFFASVAVLLIGVARWYVSASAGRNTSRSQAQAGSGRQWSATAKISSLFTRKSTAVSADSGNLAKAAGRRGTVDRPGRPAPTSAGNATRNGRPVKRTAPSRSRHARPPETETAEPLLDRPRRPRTSRQSEPPPPDRRRRARTSGTREASRAAPRGDRRASAYERDERQPRRYSDRYNGYESWEPRTAAAGRTGSTNGTHHPVSRVRYRGADEPENRRPSRDAEAEHWQYDI